MRLLFTGVLASGLALLLAGCSRPTLECRWRFVGANLLTAQTNAPQVARMLNIPEARPVRALLLARAADLAWESAGGEGAPATNSLTDARVLASGLFDHLSIGESWRSGDGPRTIAVAVRLEPGLAQAWSTAWTRFWSAARPGSGKPAAEIQGEWTVAVSDATVVTPVEALKSLIAIPAEKASAFRWEGPMGGGWSGNLDMALRNGQTRWTGTLRPPLPATSPLPEWDVPPVIKPPFVQFVAARGIKPWLNSLPFFSGLPAADVPDQIYLWAQSKTNPMMYLQTYLAAPVRESTNLVTRARAAVDEALKSPANRDRYAGWVLADTNGVDFHVHGFPFAEPSLLATKLHGRDYVTFGMVPAGRSTNTIPDALRKELQRTNLLYYGWEITAEAAIHWNAGLQIWEMARLRSPAAAPANRWALAASKTMGNSITEMKVENPGEIAFTREAAGGLTAAEFMALSHWLDWDGLRHRRRPAQDNPMGPASLPTPR